MDVFTIKFLLQSCFEHSKVQMVPESFTKLLQMLAIWQDLIKLWQYPTLNYYPDLRINLNQQLIIFFQL